MVARGLKTAWAGAALSALAVAGINICATVGVPEELVRGRQVAGEIQRELSSGSPNYGRIQDLTVEVNSLNLDSVRNQFNVEREPYVSCCTYGFLAGGLLVAGGFVLDWRDRRVAGRVK